MATHVAAPPASLYRAQRGRVDVVDVPELRFAAVDGRGAPAEASFQEAVHGLYTVAYGVHFALRGRADEKVSPLEALWSGLGEADLPSCTWRALIRLPACADDECVARVKAQALTRHPELRPALARVQLVDWREGLCVQTMHVGPYADEAPTVQLLHDFMTANGYVQDGLHHEIYLGDPRRCAPEKLRTILRQPVRHSTR
jgi:hypothetical protein